MNDSRRCAECNEPIPADAPGGICPKCLYRNALPSGSAMDPTDSGRAGHFQPLPPERLAQAFPQLENLELLGRGGMGAVYKARQPSLDRPVAVKILPPELAADTGFVDRFLREAKTLARLGNHPHIVAVHDVGQTDGLLYVIMEYVDGVNLREAIRDKRLSPPEALAIIGQICDALQFAHDQGVVHRDIKPENILLDRRGRVKIADFGLAKLVAQDAHDDALTGTHQVLGTLRYMAPEQLEGSRDVDHRADIFSLGVVFYEILTGEVPLGHFPPPSKKVDVDTRLDSVVLRALHRAPQDRYQQASELKSDVETISATNLPPTKPAAIPATAARRPFPWALAVVVLVLMCLPGGLLVLGALGLGAVWFHDVGPSGIPDQREAVIERTLPAMAAQGNVAGVKQMLEQGHDPNQKDAAGFSPLLRAAIAGHAPIAKTLIDAGAELEQRSPTGTTPLMEAAFGGQLAVVRVLIDANASLKATDNEGRTALDHAAATDQSALAEFLLERGCQETGPYLNWSAHRALRKGDAREAYDLLQKAISLKASQPTRWQYQVADRRYRAMQAELYLHALSLECAQRLGDEEQARLHIGRLKESGSEKDALYTSIWLSQQALSGKKLDDENFVEETYWLRLAALNAVGADWKMPLDFRFSRHARERRGHLHSDSTSSGSVRGIVRF